MTTTFDQDHIVTVTVDDIATVVEGPDTVYRYDLPGTGIIEGWAVPAVVDQIKDLCSDYWPDIEVVIDAEERTTEMLARTLLNKGIAAYSSDVLSEDDPVELDVGEPTQEDPPGTRAVFRPKEKSRRPAWATITNAAIGGVILLVAGLSWWAMSASLPSADAGVTAAAEHTSAGSDPGATGSGTPVSDDADDTSASATPTEVDNEPITVEAEGMKMKTPPNVTLTPRPDGAMTAQGPDPDLRIVVAADPVYGVKPEAVMAEVLRMVEEDPTLTVVEGKDSADANDKVEYIELPGDGSQVTWVTWVTGDRQLSVGCHSRGEPTHAHKAACRLAADTFTFEGN